MRESGTWARRFFGENIDIVYGYTHQIFLDTLSILVRQLAEPQELVPALVRQANQRGANEGLTVLFQNFVGRPCDLKGNNTFVFHEMSEGLTKWCKDKTTIHIHTLLRDRKRRSAHQGEGQ